MKNTVRRALAYLLGMVMLLSCMPIQALADANVHIFGSVTTEESGDAVTDIGKSFVLGDLMPLAGEGGGVDAMGDPIVTIQIGDEVYKPGDTIEYEEGTPFTILFHWQEDGDSWGTFEPGSRYEFDLPGNFNLENANMSSPIVASLDSGDCFIGTFKVEHGKVVIIFDGTELEDFNDGVQNRFIDGKLVGELDVSNSTPDPDGRNTLEIGSDEFFFETTLQTGEVTLKKSMTEMIREHIDGKDIYRSEVTIDLKVSDTAIKDVTITDDLLSALFEFAPGAPFTVKNSAGVILEEGTDYTFERTESETGAEGFVLHFEELEANEKITITYEVIFEVDGDNYKEFETKVEVNEVSAVYKDVNDAEDSARTTAKVKLKGEPHIWKSYEMDPDDETGKTIIWTLGFNSGHYGQLHKYTEDELAFIFADSDWLQDKIHGEHQKPAEGFEELFEKEVGEDGKTYYVWKIEDLKDFIKNQCEESQADDGTYNYTVTYKTVITEEPDAGETYQYLNEFTSSDNNKWGHDTAGPTHKETYQGDVLITKTRETDELAEDATSMSWVVTSEIPNAAFGSYKLVDKPSQLKTPTLKNYTHKIIPESVEITIVPMTDAKRDDGSPVETIVIKYDANRKASIKIGSADFTTTLPGWITMSLGSAKTQVSMTITGTNEEAKLYRGATVTMKLKTEVYDSDGELVTIEPPYEYINDATVTCDDSSKPASDFYRKGVTDDYEAPPLEKSGKYDSTRDVFVWTVVIGGQPFLKPVMDADGKVTGVTGMFESMILELLDKLPGNHNYIDGSCKASVSVSDLNGVSGLADSLAMGLDCSFSNGVLTVNWENKDTNLKNNPDLIAAIAKYWEDRKDENEVYRWLPPQLRITYETEIADKSLLLGQTGDIEFVNQVTAEDKNNGWKESTEAEVHYKVGDQVTKQAQYHQSANASVFVPKLEDDERGYVARSNYLRYVVDVNPACLSLESGEIVIQDTMADGMQVIAGSIKLLDVAKNTYVNNFSVEYTDTGFKLTAPAGRHYKLIYWAQMDSEMTSSGYGKGVVNKVVATLEGEVLGSDGDTFTGKIWTSSSSAGGESSGTSFTVFKYANFKVGGQTGLKGVEFTLETVNANLQVTGTVGTLKTGSNGEAVFSLPKPENDGYDLTKTIFKLSETGTIDGYQPVAPIYFVFKDFWPEYVSVPAGVRRIDSNVRLGVENKPNAHTYFTGGKVIEGRAWNRMDDNGRYSFTLTAVDGAPMPNGAQDSKYTVQNVGHTITFPDILYAEAGEYWYTIEEDDLQNGLEESLVKDASKIRVKVTVSYLAGEDPEVQYFIGDDEITGGDYNFTFHNTVQKANLTVSKTVVSPVAADKEQEFTFTIQLKDAKSGKNLDANGKFGQIEFANGKAVITLKGGEAKTAEGLPVDEGGSIYYVVTEAKADGFRQSASNAEGTISQEKGATAHFTNTRITAEPVDVTLTGEKVYQRGKLNGDDFEFVLSRVTKGAPMPADTRVTNGADGKFSFGPIEFTAEGIYEYAIREINDGQEDVIYDETVYRAVVTVSRSGEALTASVTYYLDVTKIEESENGLVFTNINTKPDPIQVNLEGTKTYTGARLRGGDFTFELRAVTPEAPMPEVTQVTNAADGKFSFGPIEFTEAGVFEYAASEVKGKKKNVVYDEKEYRIEVTVRNVDNELYADIVYSIDGQSAERLAFANTYVQPTPTPTATPEPRTVTTTEEPEPTPVPVVNITGQKIWVDGDNAQGFRPDSIEVRLLRNGEIIERRTVTAADGWKYTFADLPVADERGNAYSYAVSEKMVSGYYGRVEGYNLINTLVPGAHITGNDPEDLIRTFRPGFTDLRLTEIELENLIDLFGYNTPLWGGLLGTGDETPMYPYIFAMVGVAAVLCLVATNSKRKRKLQ